jgi:hypothetical protein
MNKIRGAQIIMVLGIVLLIFNLTELDLNNIKFDKGPMAGIISNILLIVAMIVSIREMRKPKNN